MPIETTRTISDRAQSFEESNRSDNAKHKRAYELSFSIGTAYFDPWSPCTVDELLSQADKAMYEQKRSRRNA